MRMLAKASGSVRGRNAEIQGDMGNKGKQGEARDNQKQKNVMLSEAEASLPPHCNNEISCTVEMLRQAQHDVLDSQKRQTITS